MNGHSDRISAKSFADKVGQNLRKAAVSALKDTASSMKKEIGSSGNFKGRSLNQLVKIKIVNQQNPSAVVRVGFVEYPDTGKNIVILLPEGKKLGLPKAEDKWNQIYAQNKSKFKILKTKNGGYLVLFNNQGKLIPVYVIQRDKQSKLPLHQIGDRLSSQVSEKISKNRSNYE